MLFIIYQITMQNFKKFGVIEKKIHFWVFDYLYVAACRYGSVFNFCVRGHYIVASDSLAGF